MLAVKAQGIQAFDVGSMDKLRMASDRYSFKAEMGGAPYRLAHEM